MTTGGWTVVAVFGAALAAGAQSAAPVPPAAARSVAATITQAAPRAAGAVRAAERALPQAAAAAQAVAAQVAATLPARPEGTTDDVPGFGDLTVITADRMVYEGQRQFIEMQGRVVVSDPGMKMKADVLRIDLEGTNEVRMVKAAGHVVISQDDKTAWAGRATYDVRAGSYVLEDSPRVMRGRDMMMGSTITFWRGEERIECDKDARLIIQPGSTGGKSVFGGGR
ncbi:MAG: hypothetical protein FJ221_00385 [Lentisphaerae bacterium]|nr:hypothetical protein [Lentisphaerota bacterium]